MTVTLKSDALTLLDSSVYLDCAFVHFSDLGLRNFSATENFFSSYS